VAIMGKLATDHLANRARDEASQLFNTPARLRRHAGVDFLCAPDRLDDRHLLPSKKIASDRQRSALEALIANVAPAEAPFLASALLDEFSSLGKIFAQTKEAIERVVGSSSEVIDLLHAARHACVESLACEIQLRTVKSTDQTLIDYLAVSMGSNPVEQLRVLFLDSTRHLIGDEVIASGSLSSLTVYPRNIFKRTLELSASAILLVHNHPGGGIEPSQSDIEFTKQIITAAQVFEIEVCDHIIIAGARWFSFARRGLL
jgi:DNA repair protein RadC